MHATAPLACGQAMIVAGYAVRFVPDMTLVADLAKAHTSGKPDEKLTHFAMPKLLIVDAVVVTAILESLTHQVHP
ncbi:hypothetical protein OCH239_13765 [Roseivivax halodurans JCM 10272]|uniref:IstB-like ATP-binding domain-containing protein n=1 Tax=Roseivivax halodurans JCM 10272 TaxID=1449350 RepID=X7EIC9_9RHOB|nr:ATP-binding protein [Roseivivax halodurans]ETX15687.1 hypothetical protein OCH239_13765 [Roseivivax halodurans JCM 10272]